jgi:hypothetical protein
MQFDELLVSGEATHAIRLTAMGFWSGRQQALRMVAGHETDVWMPGEVVHSANQDSPDVCTEARGRSVHAL